MIGTRNHEVSSWNQKFLDYEIETHEWQSLVDETGVVGIKSFSITRLKH